MRSSLAMSLIAVCAAVLCLSIVLQNRIAAKQSTALSTAGEGDVVANERGDRIAKPTPYSAHANGTLQPGQHHTGTIEKAKRGARFADAAKKDTGWFPKRSRAPSPRGFVDTECKTTKPKEKQKLRHQDLVNERATQNSWSVICNGQNFQDACVKKLGIVCDQDGYMKRTLLTAPEYVKMANHPCIRHCKCFDLETAEWMTTEKMECVSKEDLRWLRAMPALSPA